MKKINKLGAMTLCILGLCSYEFAAAQDIKVKTGTDETLKISVGGRIYFDGAVFVDDDTDLGNGVTVPDIRIGVKADYKKWSMKVDMGFARSKVSAKDIFVQYNFKKNSYMRLGHYAEPFSIDAMESSGNIKFLTANTSSSAFAPGRKLGLQYIGWGDKFWASAGVFGDGAAMDGAEGDDGYAGTARFVFNPLQSPGKILHIGLAGSARVADAAGYTDGIQNPKTIIYKAGFNTNVERRTAIGASVGGADYQAKYAVELIAAAGPVYLQSEYFHTNVKAKHGAPSYKASGAYGQIGFLAIGGNYTYSQSWARMGNPKPGSLEFLLRYNYTDLDDVSSDIRGGRMTDASFAANYYINKYMVFKLNYTYMHLGEYANMAVGENISMIQARFQVVF